MKKANTKRLKHYKKPIVPLKDPNNDIGHPIGMLLNDLTTITEKSLNLNNKLTTSDPVYFEKKLIPTVRTLPTNKFIRSEEIDSRQDLRQPLFNVPKTLPPRVSSSVNPYEVIVKQHLPSAEEKIEYLIENDGKITDTRQGNAIITDNNQHTLSREKIAGYDDNHLYEDFNEKPHITTKSVVTIDTSSIPTDNLNKNTRSSKEQAAIFGESLSEGEINDLGDASMNQLKILAADVNTVNKLSNNSTKEINPVRSNRRSINYHRSLDENILNRLKRLEKELKVVKTQVNDDNKIIKDLKTIVQNKEIRRAKQASKTIYHVTKAIRERRNYINNKIKILGSPIQSMFDSTTKADVEPNNSNKHKSRVKINKIESIHQYKTASKLKQNNFKRKFDLDEAENVHEAVNDTLTESNEKMYIDDLNDSIEEYKKMQNLETNKSHHTQGEPLNFDETTMHIYNSQNKRKRFMIARRDTIKTIQNPTSKNYRLRDYYSDRDGKKHKQGHLMDEKPQQYIYTVNFDQGITEKDTFDTNILYQHENTKDMIESDDKLTAEPVKLETTGSDRDNIHNSEENKFSDEGMKTENNNNGNHEKATYDSDSFKQGDETNDEHEMNSNKLKNNNVNVDNIISSGIVRDKTDIQRSSSLFNIYEYPDQIDLTTTKIPLTTSNSEVHKVRNNKHIKKYHLNDNSIQVSKIGGTYLNSIEKGKSIAETQKARNEKVKENRDLDLDYSETKRTQFRYSNDIHDMNISHSKRSVDKSKNISNYLNPNQLKIDKEQTFYISKETNFNKALKPSESTQHYANKLLPLLQSYNYQINKTNTALEIKSPNNQNVPQKNMSSINVLNKTIGNYNVTENRMNTNNHKRYSNENAVPNVSDYNLRGPKVGDTIINHLNNVDKRNYNSDKDQNTVNERIFLNETSSIHSSVHNRDLERNNNEAKNIFKTQLKFKSNVQNAEFSHDNHEINKRQEKYNSDVITVKSAYISQYKQNNESQKQQRPEKLNKKNDKKYFSNQNLHTYDDKNVTKVSQDDSTHSSKVNTAVLHMNDIKESSKINPIKIAYTSNDFKKDVTKIVNKDLKVNALKQFTTSLNKIDSKVNKENFNTQNRTNTTKENLELKTM